MLESEFLLYLADLQPKPAYVKLFRAVVMDRWRENGENADREMKRTSTRIEELEVKRGRYVEMLAEGRISQEAYDGAVSQVEDNLQIARVARRELQVDQIEVEAILDFAERLLSNLASVWTAATFEQKLRIQRAILPSGLPYTRDGFGNSETIGIFKYLREIEQAPVGLASPTGFEPVLAP
ncbi:MAG: site-specific recombinase [Thermoanaerobaculia bacterium]|nr:site-specific recombinase [Thermoanaerobaculia bacterium]